MSLVLVVEDTSFALTRFTDDIWAHFAFGLTGLGDFAGLLAKNGESQSFGNIPL